MSSISLEKPPPKLSLFHQTLAATGGSFVTNLCVQPFDVIKTRQQVYLRPNLSTNLNVGSSRIVSVPSTIHLFRSTIVNEGIRSLWRGLSPTLMMAIPATGIYFPVYENLRKKLEPNPLAPAIAGITARSFAAAITSPLELMRTLMQSQTSSSKLSCLQSVVLPKKGFIITFAPKPIAELYFGIVQTRGYKGLWLGLGPTLLRDVPFSGIYWIGYENLKSSLVNYKQIHSNDTLISTLLPSNSFIHFLSGFISGSVAATITIPVDVIKTRLQVNPLNSGSSGLSAVISEIRLESGFRGFFSGLFPRIAKVAPSAGIMIASYELFKSTIFRVLHGEEEYDRAIAYYAHQQELQQQQRKEVPIIRSIQKINDNNNNNNNNNNDNEQIHQKPNTTITTTNSTTSTLPIPPTTTTTNPTTQRKLETKCVLSAKE